MRSIWARFNPKVHTGLPECLFELDGARLYDPRRDSSVGGAGPQRWDDQGSWSGFGDPANDNPIVQVLNLWLGLRDPVTDGYLWGGRGDILQSDLPSSSWFAAMNECDALASGDGGDEAQYRTGLEILMTEDAEPASAAEEILKGCQGQIAFVAGQWLVKAGPASASVWAFSDDDVIVTSPEDFDPFPGLDAVFNAVTATYPEPEDGWQPKDAPKRSTRELPRRGRRPAADRSAAVPGGAVPLPGAAADALGARGPAPLPPPHAGAAARGARSGAARRRRMDAAPATATTPSSSQIDLVEDLPSGCVAVSLREVDPADYDFDGADLLPTSVGFSGRPPRLPWPKSFSVSGVSLPDADGEARYPAIKLDWNPDVRATGVRWKYRLAGQDDTVPQIGGADYGDEDAELYGIEVFAGQPLEVAAGEALVSGWFSDVAAGTTVITPVLPLTAYEVKARYAPDGDWSAWLPVTTPPTYLKAVDLDAALNDRVDQAQANADAAAADAAAALDAASAAQADVAALAGDTIDDLNALIAALGGIDAGDVLANRALALAALQTGWNADPTFQGFTGDLPDHWTHAGLTGHASPFAGYYGGGIAIDTPGATTITLRAASDVAGQMPAADPAVEWVVVYAMLTVTAGDPDAIRIRAAWKASGSSTWTAGHMRGVANALGTLTQHGLAVKPGVTQGFEVLVQRPVGADADAVSVFLGIDAAFATPVDLDVHLLGIRAATEAEIAANAAPGALAAAVTTLTTEITGISRYAGGAADQPRRDGARRHPGASRRHLPDRRLDHLGHRRGDDRAAGADRRRRGEPGAQLLHPGRARGRTADAGRRHLGGALRPARYRRGGDRRPGGVPGHRRQPARRPGQHHRERGAIRAAWSPTAASSARRGRAGTPTARRSRRSSTSPAGRTSPATFSTVAKSGTTAPLSTCPTPWCCAIGYSSAARTAENERYEAKEGDYVTAAFQYAVAAGGSATLRLIIRWLDAGGVQIGTAISDGPAAAASTLWSRWTSAHIGPAPAATAFVRIDLQRMGGGAGIAYVTGVEARKADTRARRPDQRHRGGGDLGQRRDLDPDRADRGAVRHASRPSSPTPSRRSPPSTASPRPGCSARRPGRPSAPPRRWPSRARTAPRSRRFRLAYDLIDLDGRVTARDLNVSSSASTWSPTTSCRTRSAGGSRPAIRTGRTTRCRTAPSARSASCAGSAAVLSTRRWRASCGSRSTSTAMSATARSRGSRSPTASAATAAASGPT